MTDSPSVTWPSPARTTLPPRRTDKTVVERISRFLGMSAILDYSSVSKRNPNRRFTLVNADFWKSAARLAGTVNANGDFMSWDSVQYKHQELTQIILGVFYEVYNELGHGFLESVYQEAMLIALRQKGGRGEAQGPLPVRFRGERIGDFRADLIVGNAVIVELRAGRGLYPIHDAQLVHSLREPSLEPG